ncbi:Mov34/MPN/PAD-1 family protein [Mesorhizobium silamurunense]|uniref:Mov34/MPN/PAD-1 family protein n=1 Tax=Mesorhizobium silamurunense TaxID=499528 RepID=UPI001782A235|nr:Mov34/MPN/PAD-1 family protein [Mesorhizobium silamurunense]
MTAQQFERHAQQFARVAADHRQCAEAGIIGVADDHARVYVVLSVEMPLPYASKGSSPNGVKLQERVEIRIAADYPWKSPSFFLREDFPRDLPHLSAGGGKSLPRPCLVDGSIDEYFSSFGLVEIGILQVLSQMAVWLAKAAVNGLMDPEHGWEPVMRHDLDDVAVVDPAAVRGRVGRDAGAVWLRSDFFRYRSGQGRLSGDEVYLTINEELAASVGKLGTFPFDINVSAAGHPYGKTITAVFWAADNVIAKTIFPETIETLEDLAARAKEFGFGPAFDAFLRRLEERWESATWTSQGSLPIGVIFCARRPFKLIGRDSGIELLPYIFDVSPRKKRENLYEGPSGRRAVAARQVDKVSLTLLRTVSASADLGKIALIGCGSVGSKVGLHLARAGATITALVDKGILQPHNMARHALVRDVLPLAKATELASELSKLGQKPQVYLDDAARGLAQAANRTKIAPAGTNSIVNTTASLLVRDALSIVPPADFPARVTEIALFGRGKGAFVLHEGLGRNPTLADLEVELSAKATEVESALLFDEKFGLTEIQIGDGCGSLTMPMTDARLSAMSAAATEVLADFVSQDAGGGIIAVGTQDANSPTTTWRSFAVPTMITVSVDGADWTLKISADVDRRIREEIAVYPHVETGGLMVGACSARTKTITVVDLLPAPPDSQRSSSLFVLGKQGLKEAVMERHLKSGKRLLDVGTWHSHLAEQGPSPTDWCTAKDLAGERSPPAVLLIATPSGYCSIVHDPSR